ncbi:hypothetical protein B0H12DRAFT_1234257 [Mycena haematopus]|nr:hypothetical protein B0H12DRAFT_1234257 [Mycena haematopus]
MPPREAVPDLNPPVPFLDRPLQPGEINIVYQLTAPVPRRRRRRVQQTPEYPEGFDPAEAGFLPAGRRRAPGFDAPPDPIVLPPPPPSYIPASLGHTIHVARAPRPNDDAELLARFAGSRNKAGKADAIDVARRKANRAAKCQARMEEGPTHKKRKTQQSPGSHAAAHMATCQNAKSLSFEGAGRTDGEGLERGWAMLNATEMQ